VGEVGDLSRRGCRRRDEETSPTHSPSRATFAQPVEAGLAERKRLAFVIDEVDRGVAARQLADQRGAVGSASTVPSP